MKLARHLSWAALAALLASACGGNKTTGSTGTGGNGACGPSQIADAKGGCQDVGLTGCDQRFLDKDGICRPSMSQCDKGTIPAFTEGCVAVGIPSCAAVFLDADGICRPSAAKCASSEYPVPQKGCVPIDGPSGCGTGTWGDIPDDASNVYVDASYAGGDGDGSKAKPFPTINEALAVVAPGGRVAIAEGHYPETLAISQDVQIAGRCPSKVLIDGNDGDPVIPAVIRVEGGKVSVRGVGLGGDGIGVLAMNAGTEVTVDTVSIQSALSAGVLSAIDASLTLKNSVVAGTRSLSDVHGNGASAQGGGKLTISECAFLSNAAAGLEATGSGSQLTVSDAVVQGTASLEPFSDGDGVSVSDSGSATVTAVALVENENSGVHVEDDSQATVKQSIFLGTFMGTGLGTWAGGYVGQLTMMGDLTMDSCVFEKNINAVGSDSKVTLSKSLVHDFGPLLTQGTAEITDTVFDKVVLVGLEAVAFGPVTLKVTRVLVEDSAPYQSTWGVGLAVDGEVDATLDSIYVSRGFVAGVLVTNGAKATVKGSRIDGVQDGTFLENVGDKPTDGADGVVVSAGAQATIDGVDVQGCARNGVIFADSGGTVARSILNKNRFGYVTAGKAMASVDASTEIEGNTEMDRLESAKDMKVPTKAPSLPMMP
jgi:hypothetical protein